jgi:hypothetical protein
MIVLIHADGTRLQTGGTAGVRLTEDVVELRAYHQGHMDPIIERAARDCTRLARLHLYGCPRFTSVSYRFPELTEFVANGCRDLRTVIGLDAPKLTLLRVGGTTPVTKTRIPEHFHPIVLPRSKMARSSPRPKPTPRKGADARRIRLIRGLLRDMDIDRVDQGVELAAALGDDEVFRGLLENTSLEQKPLRSCCPRIPDHFASQLRIRDLKAWRLHHNGTFNTTAGRRHVRDHAVLSLLAAWGDHSIVDCSAVDSYVVSAVGATRVDLQPVAALMPNLETLTIWRGPCPVENWDALHRLPKLRRLVTWDLPPHVPPQVDVLHVERPDGVGLRHVRRMVLALAPSPSEVAVLQHVEDLTTQIWRNRPNTPATLSAMAALPALRRLEIQAWGELDDVGRLGASTSLEELVLNTNLLHPKSNLEQLFRCPTLKRVKLRSKHRRAVPHDKQHLLL